MKDFEEIYRQYFQDVFLYLRGLTVNEHLAEELTEETFFKAIKALDTFKGNCEIRVWLCQIAKNSYYSHLKKQKRTADSDALETIAASEANFESLLADKEVAFQLHQLLHQLSEPYKEVFSLRIFGELSFRQIGSLFDKSEHWACVTFHRAKEKIQHRWEDSI